MKFFFALLGFSLIPFSSSAVTRYVTQNGAGSMNGTSWANAFAGTSLQAAINASTDGDEVWVAKGTYYTTSGTQRNISFSMKNGVSIYGNFNGTETLLSQRAFTTGVESVLSGEIGSQGPSDNSYHVISNKNINSTASLDGFVITGGNDERAATAENQGLGGGVYNDGAYGSGIASPTLRNCVITNNRATFGGGVFNNGQLSGNANPTLINCVLSYNIAYEGGGAMDNFGLGGTTNPSLHNCLIIFNQAQLRGGAFYNWGGNGGSASPVLVNCTVSHNSAQTGGGGFVCDNQNASSGNSGTATPNLKNCIVYFNASVTGSPQFLILGTAKFNATYTDIDLSNQTGGQAISGATTGNIDQDPKFLNKTNEKGMDGILLTKDDGFSLNETSPCIDKGENNGLSSSDILNRVRIGNGTADMGAYEFYSTVGLEETQRSSAISVHPNPSNGLIVLNKVSKGATVKVLNSIGQVVEVLNYDGVQLDLSKLAKGSYYLVISELRFTQTMKFVKE